MAAETMEEYALASAEVAYENPGEQEPMGFMKLSGEIQGSENASPRWTGKVHFSPPPLAPKIPGGILRPYA